MGKYIVLIITAIFLSIYISGSVKLIINGIFNFKVSVMLFCFAIISPIQKVAFCLNTDDTYAEEMKKHIEGHKISIAIISFILGCLDISEAIDINIEIIKSLKI